MVSSSDASQPKKVFVISPIGANPSKERTRADRFLTYIVRAALREPDYEIERADENDSPFAITAAMLSSIVSADICVADITGRNPNVFYELALAHALDKHVVIMDGDSAPSPFDIQDQRAIKYGLMPEEIEAAVEQLAAKVKSPPLDKRFKDMMNPVATAFRAWQDREAVAHNGDPAQQALFDAVLEIRDKLNRTERSSQQATRVKTPSEQLGDRVRFLLHSLIEFQINNQLDESLNFWISVGSIFEDEIAIGGMYEPSKLSQWMADAEYIISKTTLGQKVTEDDVHSFRL